MMGDFMKHYLKIQKDIAEAPDDDKGMEEPRVADAVDALIELYQDEGRTDYQLALLCIQITWWANPNIHGDIEEYGEEVFTLCQEMREAEPHTSCGGVFAEVLEYLQSEAREALAYVREQADRVRRRPRAMKWHHYIQDDVRRPRVVPMSRRIALKRKQQSEEGLEDMDTGDDADGGENSEDDMQEEQEDDDGMETDDLDEEEEQEPPFNKYPVGSTDGHEYFRQVTAAKENDHVAAPTNGSESGTDDSSCTNDDHKMTLISNSGDVVAEISDLESSVYLKAFIQYWNDNPAAWRKRIDLWEQTNGIPGRSILHCLKREDGEELREMGEIPFRMAVRSVQAASKAHAA